jgi:hypothetical protein
MAKSFDVPEGTEERIARDFGRLLEQGLFERSAPPA